jgi:hypothetical protein
MNATDTVFEILAQTRDINGNVVILGPFGAWAEISKIAPVAFIGITLGVDSKMSGHSYDPFFRCEGVRLQL